MSWKDAFILDETLHVGAVSTKINVSARGFFQASYVFTCTLPDSHAVFVSTVISLCIYLHASI